MPTQFPGYDEPRIFEKAEVCVPFELTYDAAAGTYTVPVPAGYIVIDVVVNVTTAFNATSPTLKVGDGDDDDGYLTSAQIAPATARTVTTPAVKRSSAQSNPFQYGKYYDVADTVDFIFSPGTGGTAGKLKGFVKMLPHAGLLGVVATA